jgi:hypothetical protein
MVPLDLSKLLILKYLVPKKGLEPPHPCEYVDLNHARLPIPPLRHLLEVQQALLNPAATLSLANAACCVNSLRCQSSLAPEPGFASRLRLETVKLDQFGV